LISHIKTGKMNENIFKKPQLGNNYSRAKNVFLYPFKEFASCCGLTE